MNPKEHFRDLLINATRSAESGSSPEETDQAPAFGPEEKELLDKIIDGMGAGTARLIIEQELSDGMAERFNIESLENKGRYYLARVFLADSDSAMELVIDKQTGRIIFHS